MEVTKQVWQSEVQTIDFEKVLVVMEGLSRGFIPYALTLRKTQKLLSDSFSFFNK